MYGGGADIGQSSGIGADKHLLAGATDDEFSMIFSGARKQLRFIPRWLLLGRMGLPDPVRRRWLAANRDVKGTAATAGRYVTDRMFRTFILRLADARGTAPTWLYRFAWRSAVHRYAVHCIDVPFFFDCLAADGVRELVGEAVLDDGYASVRPLLD